MNKVRNKAMNKFIVLSILTSMLLVGCGGGNGTTADTAGGSITGSALSGEPLADGVLTITDSTLPFRQETFDITEDGTFSLDEATINSLGNGPYLLKAEGTAGNAEKTLYGIAFKSDQGASSIISPFSEAIITIASRQSLNAIEVDPSLISLINGVSLASLKIANDNLIKLYGTQTLIDFDMTADQNFRTVAVDTDIDSTNDTSGFDNLLDLVKLEVVGTNIEIDGSATAATALDEITDSVSELIDNSKRAQLSNKKAAIRAIRAQFKELNALFIDVNSAVQAGSITITGNTLNLPSGSDYQTRTNAIFASTILHGGSDREELFRDDIVKEMINAKIYSENPGTTTVGFDFFKIKSVGVVSTNGSDTAKVAYRLIKKCSSGCQSKDVSRQFVNMEKIDGTWKIKGDGKNAAIFVTGYKRLYFPYNKDTRTFTAVTPAVTTALLIEPDFDATETDVLANASTAVADILVSGSGITGNQTMTYNVVNARWEETCGGSSCFPGVKINNASSIPNASYTFTYRDTGGTVLGTDAFTIAKMPGNAQTKTITIAGSASVRQIFPKVNNTTLSRVADINNIAEASTDSDMLIAWTASGLKNIRTEVIKLSWTNPVNGSETYLSRKGFNSATFGDGLNRTSNKGCKDSTDGVRIFAETPSCTIKMQNTVHNLTGYDAEDASPLGEREVTIVSRTPSQNKIVVKHHWK